MLQIALDNLNLQSALLSLEKIHQHVDIIEIGTILLCAEGINAIVKIKRLYQQKIILADAKIADAGNIISKMLFDAKADIITAICCAHISTIDKMQKLAKSCNKNIQIELTGYWTWTQAVAWKAIGIQQVVYHRSRDAELAGQDWTEKELHQIKKLNDMGFKVTITGGINLENLNLFQGIPIYIVIAGRSIRNSPDPTKAAWLFQKAITKIWS